MANIIISFGHRQLIHVQAFSGIGQAGCFRRILYFPGLQKTDPFIQVVDSQLVKLVNTEQIIFREYFSRFALRLLTLFEAIAEEHLALSVGQFKDIIRVVQPLEHGFTVIDIILGLPQGEVYDVDGINLPHLVIVIAQVDIVGDDLGNTIKDTVEIGQLTRVLNLKDGKLPLFVLCEDVYPIKLIVLTILIALALQEFRNLEFLIEQRLHQSLQHGIVGLVAKQSFHCPVKSYIVCHNNTLLKILSQRYAFSPKPPKKKGEI